MLPLPSMSCGFSFRGIMARKCAWNCCVFVVIGNFSICYHVYLRFLLGEFWTKLFFICTTLYDDFLNINMKIRGASGPTAATAAEQRRQDKEDKKKQGWHFLPSKLLFLAGLFLDVEVEAEPVQDMVQLLFSLVFPLSRSICCNSKWNISATDWKMGRIC